MHAAHLATQYPYISLDDLQAYSETNSSSTLTATYHIHPRRAVVVDVVEVGENDSPATRPCACSSLMTEAQEDLRAFFKRRGFVRVILQPHIAEETSRECRGEHLVEETTRSGTGTL